MTPAITRPLMEAFRLPAIFIESCPVPESQKSTPTVKPIARQTES